MLEFWSAWVCESLVQCASNHSSYEFMNMMAMSCLETALLSIFWLLHSTSILLQDVLWTSSWGWWHIKTALCTLIITHSHWLLPTAEGSFSDCNGEQLRLMGTLTQDSLSEFKHSSFLCPPHPLVGSIQNPEWLLLTSAQPCADPNASDLWKWRSLFQARLRRIEKPSSCTIMNL